MRKIVETAKAPAAIASYSQAVVTDGELLFTAGQIGIDPHSGELVERGISAQTERVMENLKAILEAGGSSLDRVVKCNIYMVDMADYQAINEIYSRYFRDEPPARAAVQVAGLPKGALVEIDCIASIK